MPAFLYSPQALPVWLVAILAIPLFGILMAFCLGGRYAREVTLATLGLGLVVIGGVVVVLWNTGEALTYFAGGWAPPLGIALRVDGLSGAMLLVGVLIVLAAALYAPSKYRVSPEGKETRESLVFWILLLSVWVSMNAIFLGSDFFNLYVALEMLTFAGVPLVCLSGSAKTLQAALRYLIFALAGSALYLLGVVILYANYGTLDMMQLARAVHPSFNLWVAVALMTVGLAAKTALFPFHIWLPPAHAGAPPAASALLSALVVKGSFFLIVRLWILVLPILTETGAAQFLGGMGAGAILVGGMVALRQTRLKLLIAYSTVAQIGYLFLLFPLYCGGMSSALWGGMFQAISHAFAKASMFMAAGLFAEVLGHDRLVGLRGVGRILPLSALGFGLAALSLVGVPPTGGFYAKWLLLTSAFRTTQWAWVIVIGLGGLLAGAYMYRALSPVWREPDQALPQGVPVSRLREGVVVALALCALLTGLFPQPITTLLRIGHVSVTQHTLQP